MYQKAHIINLDGIFECFFEQTFLNSIIFLVNWLKFTAYGRHYLVSSLSQFQAHLRSISFYNSERCIDSCLSVGKKKFQLRVICCTSSLMLCFCSQTFVNILRIRILHLIIIYIYIYTSVVIVCQTCWAVSNTLLHVFFKNKYLLLSKRIDSPIVALLPIVFTVRSIEDSRSQFKFYNDKNMQTIGNNYQWKLHWFFKCKMALCTIKLIAFALVHKFCNWFPWCGKSFQIKKTHTHTQQQIGENRKIPFKNEIKFYLGSSALLLSGILFLHIFTSTPYEDNSIRLFFGAHNL